MGNAGLREGTLIDPGVCLRVVLTHRRILPRQVGNKLLRTPYTYTIDYSRKMKEWVRAYRQAEYSAALVWLAQTKPLNLVSKWRIWRQSQTALIAFGVQLLCVNAAWSCIAWGPAHIHGMIHSWLISRPLPAPRHVSESKPGWLPLRSLASYRSHHIEINEDPRCCSYACC